MKLLLLLLFLNMNDPNLWGTWKCVKTETSYGTASCNQRFTLNEDGTGIEYTHNKTFSFTLEDSVLKIGNDTYNVINLTSRSLIIEEQSSGFESSNETYHFVKED